MDTLAAIVHTARIISRTSSAILTAIHPTERLGYDAGDRATLKRYGNDFLRSALYDSWLLFACGEELKQIFRKGIPQPLHLPSNRLVTQAFCVYLSEPRWRQYGFPDVEGILPREERGQGRHVPMPLFLGFSVGTPEEQLRDALLLASNMRDRALKEAKERANQVEEPIVPECRETENKTTVEELRRRVADLEASEKVMREEIRDMKRMWEDKFGVKQAEG